MAYPGVFYCDDGKILRAMQRASDNGAMIMMHAENGIAIDVLVAAGARRAARPTRSTTASPGRRCSRARRPTGPSCWPTSPATARCTSCTCRRRRRSKRWPQPRHEGRNVFAETCPQYLYLTLEETLAKPGFEGAKWVCSPPLRTDHDHHQADLWKGLRTNDLAVVSTDHCPFCFKDQKELGVGDFSKIPNGIGGVEHRMDLIYQGVVTGDISLTRWVETCCTTPARMFGLFPRKGIIAPGSDADIVVYDPGARQTISHATHHMNMDHSAWEGVEIDGRVDTVMSRGTVVVEGDRFVGTKGHGQYLQRGLTQYLN